MLLITGITGHTGKYFYEKLIEENYTGKIRFLVRKSSDISFLQKSNLNYEIFIGDSNEDRTFLEATKGVKTIVHIFNIRHSVKLLEAAIANKVEKIVAVHTTGIYSNFKIASDEYKVIEEKIEEILAESKYKPIMVRLRPSMIYGDICDRNISKFIKMVDKMRVFPIINKGENYIQPIHAKDLARSCYDALMYVEKSEIYDVTGDRPLEFKYVLNTISDELGKKTIFVSIPLQIGVILAKILKITSLNKFDYIEKVLRMSEDRSYSHEKAKNDFGYSPLTFEEGIKREVRQYIASRGK